MPHPRRRPRVAPTGRVSLRLTTEQRDQFLASSQTPRELGHTLHRAVVRNGKLTIRVTRDALEALIIAAARTTPTNRHAERALDALLRYLESRSDQFAEAEGEAEDRND
jgi:DNA/RNA-binding domain of Phe-tRNA-synthetase-like protein